MGTLVNSEDPDGFALFVKIKAIFSGGQKKHQKLDKFYL